MCASIGLALLVAACEPSPVDLPPVEPGDPEVPAEPVACVPDEAAYAANARPVIDAKCGACHGDAPQFGAPFALTRYADLVAGAEGERIVDRMLASLLAGTMPPANAPTLLHAELDTLVSWASCGTIHPDPARELVASQPVFAAPEDPPADAVPIELLAEEFPVGPQLVDHYQRFDHAGIVAEDRFIRRIEPVIDESRVVHHITVRQQSTGRYLYTWAPGTAAIQFPEGGLRLAPTDVLEVEVHYNNGAGLADVRDSSGMRLWLADPAGTEWGMVDPQTWGIVVPPMDTAEAHASCEARSTFTVLAGMPHMHEVGDTFRQVLIRQDGTTETMIELSGWSFEAQYFYQMPFTVQDGDRIEITCGYRNDTDRFVVAGLGTADEMCFDFMYVTPANARLSCPLF